MLGYSVGEGKTKSSQGQATVEFALTIILLMLLLFGIIDFSRLMFAYATMSNGVREGARYGIIHRPLTQDPASQPADPNAMATVRHAEAMMVLVGGEATVTVDYPGGDNPTDPDFAQYVPGCTAAYYCRVRVRAESDFNTWTPLIPSFTIETQATMHFE